MRNALAAALDGRAALVFAEDAGALESIRTAPRAAGVVLVVIAAGVPKLDRAMLLAAIGPLAAELAPGTRLAALDLDEGADPADVAAAALFLATARSTTGQALRIAAR